MARYRLMTNNIWNSMGNTEAWKQNGEDCSPEVRVPLLGRVYEELLPDVLGMQEANHKMVNLLQIEFVKRALPYTILFAPYTSIAYRTDRFELLDTAYLPYPVNVEGLEGDFNDCGSKSLHIAVLRAKEDGKIIVFSNTHLWWKHTKPRFENDPWYLPDSDKARVYQMELASELIAKYQKKYGGAPAVFLGDMNCPLHSDPIDKILSLGFTEAHDVATEYACEENGYHYCFGDGHKPYVPGKYEDAIDHILVRDIPEGFCRRLERFTPDWYEIVSDHYPAYIDIEY